MATDLTGLQVTVTMSVKIKAKKAGDHGDATYSPDISFSETFAFGDGDGQADMFWSDQRTLAFGATDAIDLYGALSTPLSPVVSFDKVKCIIVWNRSDEAGVHAGHAVATDAQITVGGAAANEFVGPFDTAGDAVKIEAGNAHAFINKGDGWACAAGSDILNVVNNDGADQALFDIIVFGVSD